MSQISITNVINVSVSEAPQGIGAYNTSNLALFTEEAYAESFGSLGYNIYLDPTQVGIDFGTSSQVFKMANAIFSQQPNILAGGGYLVIIPYVVAVQNLALSGVPASGSFELVFTQGTTAAIEWNDSATSIQTKIQAVPGLGQVSVSGSLASESVNLTFYGVYGPESLPTITANSLMTSAPASITVTPTSTTAGETYAAAITRTVGLVQYFGLMTDIILDQADTLAAAAVIQPLNKIGGFVSMTEADIEPGGTIDLLRTGDFTQSRGLYYNDGVASDALVMMASYFGLAFSTNFDGSDTTSTMHLKDLIGVQPDPSMTQTILNLAQAAGADVYISLQGVPKVFTSGANSFFDEVYNLRWFVGALQVAGFNFLAETSTKIPQTESGVTGLKNAYRQVCEQAVTNQYSAPGTWTSPSTFGNQVLFLQNISQRGYYIYSTPVAQQSQTSRAARQAPLVQIALKEAGAIQSSNVIVNINA